MKPVITVTVLMAIKDVCVKLVVALTYRPG